MIRNSSDNVFNVYTWSPSNRSEVSDVRFGSELKQIVITCDKFLAFSNNFPVHFGSQTDLCKRNLSHKVPIWILLDTKSDIPVRISKAV